MSAPPAPKGNPFTYYYSPTPHFCRAQIFFFTRGKTITLVSNI